jgi:hypothetical protein
MLDQGEVAGVRDSTRVTCRQAAGPAAFGKREADLVAVLVHHPCRPARAAQAGDE